MEIIKIILVYFVWFLTLLILDYIWLWYITKSFIIWEFKDLVIVDSNWNIKVNLIAWLIAWFVISAMIVTFVTFKYDKLSDIILYWALLGFFSYAMYDLTNLTFIKDYSISFTLVDIAWWTFACSIVAITSFYFFYFIK